MKNVMLHQHHSVGPVHIRHLNLIKFCIPPIEFIRGGMDINGQSSRPTQGGVNEHLSTTSIHVGHLNLWHFPQVTPIHQPNVAETKTRNIITIALSEQIKNI